MEVVLFPLARLYVTNTRIPSIIYVLCISIKTRVRQKGRRIWGTEVRKYKKKTTIKP